LTANFSVIFYLSFKAQDTFLYWEQKYMSKQMILLKIIEINHLIKNNVGDDVNVLGGDEFSTHRGGPSSVSTHMNVQGVQK